MELPRNLTSTGDFFEESEAVVELYCSSLFGISNQSNYSLSMYVCVCMYNADKNRYTLAKRKSQCFSSSSQAWLPS